MLAALAGPPQAQVLRVAELTAEEIRALDRDRTAVILPGGVLEQHGPYLPSYTDGYMNEWWTERLAEAIAARPGWTALVFPMVPLGNGGANEIGGHFVFPGTYSVRTHTLRAVFMDLGTELGEQGFRKVFIVHNHGSPVHNRALDQAAEYFGDTYGGFMVNLTGLEPEAGPPDPRPTAEQRVENGAIDAHAGLSETSRMLFLRPRLVDPGYAGAASLGADDPGELLRIARAEGWPGYLGAPRLATAAFGASVMQARADRFIRVALAILDGLDPSTVPRYADSAMEDEAVVVEGILLNDAERAAAQDDWLRRRGYR
jgi:creatinine amidohydrolase/Fe(II)-dependent formamide hydrolase-like protein